jgi:flagellar protein FlgJ
MAEFDTQSGINIGMVQDVQNLDKLRQMSLSKEGKQGALMAAARQFESIFTQTLFKDAPGQLGAHRGQPDEQQLHPVL